MSDNVTKLHNRLPRGRKLTVLIVVTVLVLAALVLILFGRALRLPALGRKVKYLGKETVSVSFDTHSSNRYVLWNNGLAIGSVGGLEAFSSKGESVCDLSVMVQNPAVQSGDKTLLLYDAGGSSLRVFDSAGAMLLEASAPGGFYDADISAGDTVCSVSSESGYKTVLRVYDKDQQEIYRWFSASQYMPLCAVSANGRHAAAVGLGQKDGSFLSSLSLFRTDMEKPEAVVEMGDSLAYDMAFVSDRRLCVIGEDAVCFYNTDGQLSGRYDLSSWFLEQYDMHGDGFVLLSVNMYKAGDRCSAVTLDHDGNQKGSLFVGAEILDISACGKYVSILTTEELIVCYDDLEVCHRAPNTQLATGVCQRKDGSVFLISGNTAELYIP